jgi:hypothetical protein
MPNPENIEPYKFTSERQPARRGRPKGSRNRSTVVRKWLETSLEITGLDGRRKRGRVVDAIVLRLIRKAIVDGNVAAARELLDSAYGRAPETIEHTGKDGAPMQHVVIYIPDNGRNDRSD